MAVRRARRKDRLEPFLGRLNAYALALCRDGDHARDLVQECALRVLQARRVPEDGTAYRAWLFKILRNVYIDRVRANRHEPMGSAVDLEDLGQSRDVWATHESLVNGLTVRYAMGHLSEEKQEVMVLVDIVGLTYAETADVLEVPRGTVMSRLARARAALLEILEESNVQPLPKTKGLARG